MDPRHSFWHVLGPAEAPAFAAQPRAVRAEPGSDDRASARDGSRARVTELITILGEAGRLAARCASMFAPCRADCGLSGIEALTLIGIAHADKPPTVPQVGRSLGHPRQVIQRAVRVLQDEGLVQPLPNPEHKRAALLVATDKGRRLGRAIDAKAAQIIAEIAEGLDLDLGALSAMSTGLLALRDRIDERMGESQD